MFNFIPKIFGLFILLALSFSVQAVVIEAEGQALIINKDISSAREAAIRDASQQASMQAAVYVSSSQVVRDGILEIDNMQLSTLGQVSNIDILDEKIIGQTLFIRIKADVHIDEGCKNGISNTYAKSVALTAFPLTQASQANLGGLYNISSDFPGLLTQHLNQKGAVVAFNAGNISLYSNTDRAATAQLDDGMLTSTIHTAGQLQVNYIISGVIRDMSMIDPRTHAENNLFIDLYNRLDYKSRKHLRNFEFDLFIHDGFSGHLISQKHYQTAGLWNLDRTINTGFNTASFKKQDFGQKVNSLMQEVISDLETTLQCEPFTALITRTDDRNIWISAGKQQGIKRGDKMTIYRKSTFYTPDMKASTELNNTRQTLVIDDVQMSGASGYIRGNTSSHNIRAGDLAIAR